METHKIARSNFDVVDALKEEVDTAIVNKVLFLPGSEARDEDVSWWRDNIIKFREAAPALNLNAYGDEGGDGKGKPHRRKGKGAQRFDKGGRAAAAAARKKGTQDGPKMEKIYEARKLGDKFVERIYTRGDEAAKALWKERKALRAVGGKPQEKPELFALDAYTTGFSEARAYTARYNDSGLAKPGYPIKVCVTCGLTHHTAGEHKNKSQ
eukprot:SAG11_NODE_3572_length_2360_cov_1.580203_1_plen_210_part_00